LQVIATAGHVDHGKSTLVQTLTGQNPDRLAEERRRGMSIELGYCWTTLGRAGEVAFVDVPGHERFVSTMLAGVGPVPAVLFVVAADDPWMPQAAEHLAALDAFGVRHGVVAVTRADLADPGPLVAEAARRIATTTLAGAPVVAVSARTGSGMQELTKELERMVAGLPLPDPLAPVRLWVDRCFSVVGAGTVVTGTLTAGTIRVGDELRAGAGVVRVRGIETLGRPVGSVSGVARAALRLGGGGPTTDLTRGTPIVSARDWQEARTLDVRVSGWGRGGALARPPEHPLVHLGSASVAARARPLGDDVYRLQLDRALPLHVGDRLVLRDPGSRAVWGGVVLDPDPPALTRRGAARRRATDLVGTTGEPDLADELRRRGVVRTSHLRRLGVPVDARAVPTLAVPSGDWLLARAAVPALREAVSGLVAKHRASRPLEPGPTVTSVARALAVPREVVGAVVEAPLTLAGGRVIDTRKSLPASIRTAVDALIRELGHQPFAAPDSTRLSELGLDGKAIAAADRAGLLLRLAEHVVLRPDAETEAVRRLGELTQPFTASEARIALGTSRRVVLPLLERLDARGLTRRLPDDRREVVAE
jgi:selenocysteine-specific elongation factor